eukprot:15421614-Alexandrium_andersonii.AAC.2
MCIRDRSRAVSGIFRRFEVPGTARSCPEQFRAASKSKAHDRRRTIAIAGRLGPSEEKGEVCYPTAAPDMAMDFKDMQKYLSNDMLAKVTTSQDRATAARPLRKLPARAQNAQNPECMFAFKRLELFTSKLACVLPVGVRCFGVGLGAC